MLAYSIEFIYLRYGKGKDYKKSKSVITTIVYKNNGTNDKVYRKVAILMYTEMFNFRPQS